MKFILLVSFAISLDVKAHAIDPAPKVAPVQHLLVYPINQLMNCFVGGEGLVQAKQKTEPSTKTSTRSQCTNVCMERSWAGN